MQAVLDFLESDRPIFEMSGYAGTGKTSVLVELAKLHEMSLVAYTGKAASVLQAKSGMGANTIHSLFYRLIDVGKDKNGKKILAFERVEQNLRGSIIGVDESSTINEEIGADLVRTGAKIISFGDSCQLPPVVGKQFFNHPSYELTEIHRQALESPIIRQAHQMRTRGTYEDDTAKFRTVRKLSDDDLVAADIVLVWRNKTRHAVNKRMRKILNRTGDLPQAGEPVMCLKNARRYGIFNGAVYTLAEAFDPEKDATIYLEHHDGSIIEIPRAGFVPPGGDINSFDDVKITTAFDFGYACTVNKAQGSEYARVALMDDYSRLEGRRSWTYTGITRASDSIIIQR